jgi:hypothetical protein
MLVIWFLGKVDYRQIKLVLAQMGLAVQKAVVECFNGGGRQSVAQERMMLV